jgi:hypothetical protein
MIMAVGRKGEGTETEIILHTRPKRWNRVGAMPAPMLGVSSQLVVVVVLGAVATMGEGGAEGGGEDTTEGVMGRHH